MKKNGFTFIELIISVSLLAIIMVSIYSAFNIGLKTYRRADNSKDIQRIRTRLLKMEKELKGAFFLSELPFNGAPLNVSFPLLISKDEADMVCIVSYEIEQIAGEYKIIRKEKPFTENASDTEEKKEQLFSVKSFKFEYGKFSSLELTWSGIWDSTAEKKLPSAVRASFQIDNEKDIYNKTIFLDHEHGAVNTQ